jgi:hypothetical protein
MVSNNRGDEWYVYGGGDYYADEFGATAVTVPVSWGEPYVWWVHGANATAGIGRASSAEFTCR